VQTKNITYSRCVASLVIEHAMIPVTTVWHVLRWRM